MTQTHYALNSIDAMGIDRSLRSSLRSVALTALSSIHTKFEDRFLRCIYCHFVFDDQKMMFENLLADLKKIGTFVDSDACLRMMVGQQPIDKRYFHLSFDDGFRNNYLNALPVLQKLEIPAIFFIPSGLIGAGYEQTFRYSTEIGNYRTAVELLNWDEVKEMMAAGYEIGSHTRTHARFSDISSNQSIMEEEIRDSKLELEDHLGRECKYISWPFGLNCDTDATALSYVSESNYAACFSACRGTVMPGKTDRFRIPRHHFEAHWKIPHVRYFCSGNMEEKE